MVSAGLLLLLLISTSLVLSSPSTHLSTNQQDGRSLQKRGEKMKGFLTAMEYTDKIANALNPFIGLIPVAGEYINSILTVPGQIAAHYKKDETMALLKFEFPSLHEKIDSYHTQDNWDRLSNIYRKYENQIMIAWKEFTSLLEESNQGQMERLKYFKDNSGIKCMQSTQTLHQSLTAPQPSFNPDFKKRLIEYSRCHEKIIKGFSILIAELFYKGITISYSIKSGSKPEDLAKMAHESGSVMFEIHKHCIINIDEHIKLDVKDLIDQVNDHSQLAKNIRLFLDKEFDRYNWMVVAFSTKKSKQKIKFLNRHALSGAFIQVEKGEVTVAVVKQLKGLHNKVATSVIEAIKRCFGEKKPECDDVIKKLESCEETVESLKVHIKDTYTAVHAFISKSDDSIVAVEAKEAPEESSDFSDPLTVPYVYTGDCKRFKLFPGGHFRVLIKSDEEVMKTPACDKLNCGEKGQCAVLGKTLIPVCECYKDFYGENCEESIDDYKKYMLGE